MNERKQKKSSIWAISFLVYGCGASTSDSSETDAGDPFVERDLHVFHACVVKYFEQDGSISGKPDARWTVSVPDRPEIATQVTDEKGCADIALPARSDVLVTATKPDWVPVGLTVHVGDADPPSTRALILQGYPGLPGWWWGATEGFVCRPGEGESGMVGVILYDRSEWLENESAVPLAGIVPQLMLHTAAGPRNEWLYISKENLIYCNQQAWACASPTPGCAPTEGQVMPYVPPGMAELEIPGVTCEPAPGGSAIAWPAGDASNVFRVDVRAGMFTGLAALCEVAQ